MLVLWSLIVLIWMIITHLGGFASVGLKLNEAECGARYVDVEANMPARVNRVSHNYTHLMEQPTLFYAVVAILALASDNSVVSLAFAWGYVLLRIGHSLWQCLVNAIPVHVVLFSLMTLCLFGLAINAVRLTLF